MDNGGRADLVSKALAKVPESGNGAEKLTLFRHRVFDPEGRLSGVPVGGPGRPPAGRNRFLGFIAFPELRWSSVVAAP